MTAGWLDPVRRALDERAAAMPDDPAPVFFRDDDAGWDDPALARLLDVFALHGATIDLAAIPSAITRRGASTLIARAELGVVRLHQHGATHVNHETEGRKCEFGPSRSAADQRADLVTGRRRLAELFGDLVEPVFTPPWNRCTPGTGALLVELGWQVLSRDHTAVPLGLPGLTEVPVTVDWFGRTRGTPWDLAERGRQVARSLTTQPATGVMFHHAVNGAADLVAIDELVGLLVAHPGAVLTTIGRLAAAVPA